jgi:transcriptional regulator with XRE-family HTH domain
VSRLENERQQPQPRTAQRLASALGWDADELFPEPTENGSE